METGYWVDNGYIVRRWRDVPARLGGLATIVFLFGALGGLGIAASAFGADSRDGANW